MTKTTQEVISHASTAPSEDTFLALANHLEAADAPIPKALEPALFAVLGNLEFAFPHLTSLVEVPARVVRMRRVFARLPPDGREAFLAQAQWRLFALALLPGAETPHLLRMAVHKGETHFRCSPISIVHTDDQCLVNVLCETDPAMLVPTLEELVSEPLDPPEDRVSNRWWIERRRGLIVRSLAQVGTPQTVSGLIRALDQSKGMREEARGALVSLCRTREGMDAVLAALKELLANGRKTQRHRAAEILATLPDDRRGRTLARERAAAERDTAVREVLVAVADRPDDDTPPQSGLIESEIDRIRASLAADDGQGWKEYEQLGGELIAIAAPWIEQRSRNPWPFRHRVLPNWAAMLSRFREEPPVPALALAPLRFLRDETGPHAYFGPTAVTVETLAEVFLNDPRFVDAVCALLDSGARVPRNTLLAWLGKVAPDRACVMLVRSLRSTLESQRRYAIRVLQERSEVPLAPLRALLEDSTATTREAAATVLARHPDPLAIPTLEKSIAVERSVRVRNALHAALEAARGTGPTPIP